MASVLCSESQAQPDQQTASICLDAPPSSSPFPSPSSSFIPPPTPGAHEFAIKPPPAGRAGRKSSVVPNSEHTPDISSLKSAPPHDSTLNGTRRDSVVSPATPTSSNAQLPLASMNGNHSPPSPPSSAATPTPITKNLPDSPANGTPAPSTSTSSSTTTRTSLPSSSVQNPVPLPQTPVTPSSPTSYFSLPSNTGSNNALDTPSTRPAPASPVISRRVSQAPSTSSVRSRSSKSSLPPSASVSRANSTRKQHSSTPITNSPTLNFSRLSSQLQNITNINMTTITSPAPSPTSFSFVPPTAAQGAGPSLSTTVKRPATYVKIRDFAYAADDKRHVGLGSDVPPPNKVSRLNRVLGMGSRMDSSGSWENLSDDGDVEDNDDDEGDGSAAFGRGLAMAMGSGFQFGVGRLSFYAGAGGGGGLAGPEGGVNDFPSRVDLDRNFLDDEVVAEDDLEGDEMFFDLEPDEDDEAADGDEGEEELYPGLYRALYAFEPEGTAEMALEEDQIVRVVGRGGGVGWAVVVDDRERAHEGEVDGKAKLALVPESYLEAVRLDG